MEAARAEQIAVAKPSRGREMRSTLIPKDVVEAVRAVSLKAVTRSSLVEQLQKPRQDDFEVYHEGYINGKLYLVPDINLQAMRDIVNLNMKRRRSSMSQPETPPQDPMRYGEFTAKLDMLLDKIDKLATSSEASELKPIGGDERERSERESDESMQLVPPILDENIKYKKVKPEDSVGATLYESLSNLFPPDFGKKLQQEQEFVVDSVMHDAKSEAEEDELSFAKGIIDFEIFRLLLSGHLKEGNVPKFIIDLNFTGSNFLDSVAPDFKRHEKNGNIDIFVTGKFFTENILVEESTDSPAFLDIKPHKIAIDQSCETHNGKFSDVFDLGPVDILLQGEFVKNADTGKYTPTFSLEILRKDESERSKDMFEVEPTTVLYSKDTDTTPFNAKDVIAVRRLSDEHLDRIPSLSSARKKHVHYAEHLRDIPTEEVDEMKRKGILEILIGKKMYKKIFCRKGDNIGDGPEAPMLRKTASQLMREAKVRRKLNLRGMQKQRKLTKQAPLKGFGTRQQEVKVYQTSGETKSPFQEKNGKDNKANDKRRKKKAKGNQIVDNPILAQMQEFFI